MPLTRYILPHRARPQESEKKQVTPYQQEENTNATLPASVVPDRPRSYTPFRFILASPMI